MPATRALPAKQDRLAARATREGTPLIEGDSVTFVWRGSSAPRLIGDFTGWERHPLTLRRVERDVWARRLDFYADAYVEYAFLDGERRVRDRFNRRRVANGIGDVNHFFYMPRRVPTDLARSRHDAPRGSLRDLVVDARPFLATEHRRIHFYAPPAPGPWRLLVALDGDEYRRRVRLATIVDNLIAQRRMQPIAIAFVPSAGDARVSEYGANESTVAFLRDRLLPAARQVLDLRHARGAHAVVGASMGGLMALHAALREPSTFGAAISQSGAFELGGRDVATFALVDHARPLRVWMDVGHLEPLVASNRRMRRALAAAGHEILDYREYHAGHNWTAWRDDVWRGLEAVFGD